MKELAIHAVEIDMQVITSHDAPTITSKCCIHSRVRLGIVVVIALVIIC